MHNMILTTIALVMRLAHLRTEHPVGDFQACPSLRCCGRNRRGGLTATFAGIVVYAAVPQCGSPQIPLTEPAQVPASEPAQTLESESAQTLESEPEAIVSELLDAMQTNDAERIRSLFDENASQAYGDGPAKSGEAFFRWLDSDIIQRQGRVENAQLAVNGNEVVVTGQYHSRGYTSEANFLLTVENGRIVSWRMRY